MTAPGPVQSLDVIASTLLACLCEAVAVRPNPPQHCCYRVGSEVAHDADIFTDLCCEGLAYVALSEIFPVIDSFRARSLADQANWVCGFPSWSVGMKMGIVRCIPTGGQEMPTCTDWNAAAIQDMNDAQALLEASCCFKQTWLDLQPGFSVLIYQNQVGNPSGGCIERFVTLQIQTGVCDNC